MVSASTREGKDEHCAGDSDADDKLWSVIASRKKGMRL